MTFMPLLGYYVLRGQKGFESAAEQAVGGPHRPRLSPLRRLVPGPQGDRAGRLRAGLAAARLLPLLGTAFFPKDLHGVFTVNVFLAEGSPIRQTQDETLR